MRVHIIIGGHIANTVVCDSLEMAHELAVVTHPGIDPAAIETADADEASGSVGDAWANGAVVPPFAVTLDEQIAALMRTYDGFVQTRIDDVARSFGYGDPNRPEVSPILHAVGYADEPAVPRFMLEWQALRAYRSKMWAASGLILTACKRGERPVPTHAELIAELDELVPPPIQEPYLG